MYRKLNVTVAIIDSDPMQLVGRGLKGVTSIKLTNLEPMTSTFVLTVKTILGVYLNIFFIHLN